MRVAIMKTWCLPLALALAACAPSKTTPMSHAIRMEIEGPRVYDYRIEYGDTVLPFGNRGDPDFGRGRTYRAEMPLPTVAVAQWRTAPLGGEPVTFEVPIRDRVTAREWNGEHFVLEFVSTPTTLKVYVMNGVGWPPASQRLIYSGSADRMGRKL